MSMVLSESVRREAAEPRFELVLEQAGRAPQVLSVRRAQPILVGRAPECGIVLDDDTISRRHATLRIDAEADAVDVEDTSINGTLADGVVLRHTGRRVGLGRPIALGSIVISVRRLPDAGDARSSGVTVKPDMLVVAPPRADVARAEPTIVPAPAADATTLLRKEVHRQLLAHLDINAIDRKRVDHDPALRSLVLVALRNIVARMALPPGVTPEGLVGEVANEVLELGPLQPLLVDETVSEIMVVDAHHIYVERGGKLELSSARFTDAERVHAVIERIVTPLGKHVDESSPLVDARLADGSRVNVVIGPLALRGPCITIRKFARNPITLDRLIELGALSEGMATFLVRAVRAKKNIVISGGTGSGKTTLLNALSGAIPEGERILTIEDAAELQLRQPHVVPMEARQPNMEGKGEVAIRQLVANSLRMRPDRIVVGECRGGEALDMLQAMNTGHDGSLTTTHANSPADALMRLETLSLMAGIALPSRAIREQLAKSVHLVVQQSRLSDGSRRVTAISEVAQLDRDGNLRLRPLYQHVQTGTAPDGRVLGSFEPTGYLPSFLPELITRGLVAPGEALL